MKMKKDRLFSRLKKALVFVFRDTRSGVYSVDDPIPETKKKDPPERPEPVWWESTAYCKANPFKKFWFALKYGVFYDRRGEAHIKFPSLLPENQSEPPVIKTEIDGCQVELHFAKDPDPDLEARVLSPLVEVMEEQGVRENA